MKNYCTYKRKLADNWIFAILLLFFLCLLSLLIMYKHGLLISIITNIIIFILFVAVLLKIFRNVELIDGLEMWNIFILALVVRICALLITTFVFSSVNNSSFLFGTYGDDYRYHLDAIKIANAWSLGYYPYNSYLGHGYSIIIAVIYYIFGQNIIFGKLFNVLIGSFLPLATYHLAFHFTRSRIAKLSGLIVALFPFLVFWSTVLYKDVVLVFLIIIAMNLTISLIRNKGLVLLNMTTIGLSVFIIGTIRLQSMIMMMVILPLILLVNIERFNIKTFGKLFIVIIMILFVIKMDNTGRILVLDNNPSWYLGYNRIEEFYQNREASLSSKKELSGIYFSFPVQFITSIFFPMPLFVEIKSEYALTEYLLMGGSMIWLTLIPFLFLGILESVKNSLVKHLPYYLLFFGTCVGIAIRGYSLIYRHRVQYYPIALIFISIGLVTFWESNSKINKLWLSIYVTCAFFMTVIYNLLRQ